MIEFYLILFYFDLIFLINKGNTQADILADYCTLLKALEKATRIISHQNNQN